MEQILEGNISVKAAILGGHRHVVKILVDQKKHDKDTKFILHRAKEKNIEIVFVNRESIDAFAQGSTHGGLIAICEKRTIEKLSQVANKHDLFFSLVEGVEDPYNFGYVIRALYAAGCDGLITPKRNWTNAAGVVAKASAGASEYISLIQADDMSSIITELNDLNVPLICANRVADAQNLYTYRFPKRFCLAIGGEMRGLSSVVIKNAQQNIYIPYANDFRNAMSAASSAAILSFEYLRQKHYHRNN